MASVALPPDAIGDGLLRPVGVPPGSGIPGADTGIHGLRQMREALTERLPRQHLPGTLGPLLAKEHRTLQPGLTSSVPGVYHDTLLFHRLQNRLPAVQGPEGDARGVCVVPSLAGEPVCEALLASFAASPVLGDDIEVDHFVSLGGER